MGLFQSYVKVLGACLLCLVVLRYLCQSYTRRKIERQFILEHGCLPPPRWKSRWPLGIDMLRRISRHASQHTTLQHYLQLKAESGTTFEQHLLGARAISTMEPENLEAVLSTNFADYGLGLREPCFHPLLGSGIFTQDGIAWKTSRQSLRPHFVSTKTATLEQIRNCVQKQLINVLQQSGCAVVDLQPLFFSLTLQTSMLNIFGEDFDVSVSHEEFASAFQTGQNFLFRRAVLSRLYWVLSPQAFRDACDTCHRFVDEAIDIILGRLDSKAGLNESIASSFMGSLVQRTRDRRVLRDQCLNILLAGRDTTACCLSWTIRLLCQHKHVFDRVVREIQDICGLGTHAEPPTRDALKRMRYLNQVIKEVLRLYPSVPTNSRTATKLTRLPVGGGPSGRSPVLVRPGEAVRYCVYAMHRRRDIYGPDADEFRPERWDDESLRHVGWAYLPFNGGPRICLGQEFALLEIAYTVARLLQVYPNLGFPHGYQWQKTGTEKQTLNIVVSSHDGCKVSLNAQEAFPGTDAI